MKMRNLTRNLITGLGLIAGTAHAGVLDEGGYVTVSPVGFSVDATTDMSGAAGGFTWGVEGGGFFNPWPGPKIAVGGFFEHSTNFLGAGARLYRYRLGPQVRVGESLLGDKLFVFGEVGLGLGIGQLAWLGADLTNVGLVVGLGGGASYHLVQQLSVDAQLEVDLESTFQPAALRAPVQVTVGASWHFN